MVAAICGLLGAGCAYFNSLYNARRAFAEAQAARMQDRSVEAASAYRDAIDKAARSYRSDQTGRWADDALYIVGRAYFYSGDWARSQAALERLLATSGDSALRAGARVHLGGIALATGRRDAGLRWLDDVIGGVPDATLRAEAHLWSARASFDLGRVQEGWASLDRAEEASRELRVQVGLERLARGLGNDHFEYALSGTTTVLEDASGEPWADTVFASMARASALWGAGPAAEMLSAAARSGWAPRARDRVRLLRARMLARAGDTVAATEEAGDVARGDSRTAHEARVALARWRLSSIDRIDELDEVRAILLPALGLPEALRLIDFMEHVALFVDRAGTAGDHLALFAGAELARDSLGSPRLAEQLFTLYADRDPGSAWEGKALMAALALTEEPTARERLAGRLERLGDNIYVQASRGTVARPTDYALVEGRLGASLSILNQRIAAEASDRDVAVQETARTLDSIRAAGELRRRVEAGDSILLGLAAPGLTSPRLRARRLAASQRTRRQPHRRILRPDTVTQADTTRPQDTIPGRDTIFRRDTLAALGPTPGPGRSAPDHDGGVDAS